MFRTHFFLPLTVAAFLPAAALAQGLPLRTVVQSGDAAPAPAPAGATFSAHPVYQCSPTIDATGRVAFQAMLSGVPANAQKGVWLADAAGAKTEIARSGVQAPGSASEFTNFGDPTLVEAVGQPEIAFRGYLTTSSYPSGIWHSSNGNAPTLVAERGDPIDLNLAPLLIGFASENVQRYTWFLAGGSIANADESALVAHDGSVMFGGRCTGPAAANAVLEAEEAGGPPSCFAGKSGVVDFGAFQLRLTRLGVPSALRHRLTNERMMAFLASTREVGTNVWGQAILCVRDRATLPNFPRGVLTGRTDPGVENGVTFTSFGDPSASTDGWFAFKGSLGNTGSSANDSGVWRMDPFDALSLVAREGQAAPGTSGATFWIFNGQVLVNTDGAVAFESFLLGGPGQPGDDRALFLAPAGGAPALVARRGDPAPGAPGCTFRSFEGFALNANQNGAQVLFTARLSGAGLEDELGIWRASAGGAPVLVARRGVPLDTFGATTNLKLATGSGGADGRRTGFNDAGQVAFFARFADGSWRILVAG